MEELVSATEKDESLANRRSLRVILRYMATDSDYSIRMHAIEELGVWGTRSDAFVVRMAVKDPEPLVRMTAYSALADLIGKSGFSTIIKGKDDPDWLVRRYVYVAAYDADPEKAIPWLTDDVLTSERVDSALVGVYTALAEAGIASSISKLKKWINHRDQYVARLANQFFNEQEVNE